MTFNEWMAHIHRELGYPEHKIKQYEQDRRRKITIQNNQQGAERDRRVTTYGETENNRGIKRD